MAHKNGPGPLGFTMYFPEIGSRLVYLKCKDFSENVVLIREQVELLPDNVANAMLEIALKIAMMNVKNMIFVTF